MATAMPPRWKDLESDERYGQLDASQRLGVFNKWVTNLKSHGTENGWWENEKTSENFKNLVKTKLPQLTGAVFEENKIGGFEDVKAAAGRSGLGVLGTGYRLNQGVTDVLLNVSKAVDYVPGLVTQGLNSAFGTDLKIDSWLTNQLRSTSVANQASIDALKDQSQQLDGGELGELADQFATAGSDAVADVGAALLTGGRSVPTAVARRAPTVFRGVLDDMAENFVGPSGRQLRIASTMGAGRSFSGTWNEAIKEYTNLGASREEAEAKATPEALNAGAATYLITTLGGRTGIESVLKNSGVQGLRGRLREVMLEASNEGIEEGADQSLQDLNERFIRNPDKAVSDSYKEIKYAVGLGTLLGGGFSLAGQTIEKLRESDSPLTADAVAKGWWETPEKTSERVAQIKTQIDQDFGPDDDTTIEEQIDSLEGDTDADTDAATTATDDGATTATTGVNVEAVPLGISIPATATATDSGDAVKVGDSFNYDGSRGGEAGPRAITEVATVGSETTPDSNPLRTLISFGDRDPAGALIFVDPRYNGATATTAPATEANETISTLPTDGAIALPPQRMGVQTLQDDSATQPEVDSEADVFSGVSRQPESAGAPPQPTVNILPAGDAGVALPPQRMGVQTLQDDSTTQPEVDSEADVFSGVSRQPTPATATVTPAPAPAPATATVTPTPDLLAPSSEAQAYEDQLVKEAKAAGMGTTGATNQGIKQAIQGKGWYPKSNINKATKEIKERVRLRLEAEAAVSPSNIEVPTLPEGATDLISENRSRRSVPTSATINSRFGSEPVEQRRAIRREAVRQLASDLGIEYSEELDFTKDFDGRDNLPIRVTATSTEPVFTNNAEITARQIDAGFSPVVPETLRGRVVEGITFDAADGRVTSSIASGVTTTSPGQLATGVRAQRPGTEQQAVLSTDTVRKNAQPFFRKLTPQDEQDIDAVRVQLQKLRPRSSEIEAAFGMGDLVEAGLIKWARERVNDRKRDSGKRKNYSASQIWNFVMQDAAEKLKSMPKVASLDAPLTEGGVITRGDTVAAKDRLSDSTTAKDTLDREAAVEESDAIDEGVASDEPADLKGSIGGASTGMNYDQAFNIVNNPRLLQGAPKTVAAKLRAEAQELLDLAPQNIIDDLENNDVDYWTFTAEDFRNVDVGNTGRIVSSSPQEKTPYISEQTSWLQSAARALGLRKVSDFTPSQFTQLARFYADRFRPIFDAGATTLPESAVTDNLPDIRAIFEAPEGAASTYRAAVDRLRAEFPGATIRYNTTHSATAWYNPRYRNQIFLNPLLLEQELDGLTASEAQPFLRALLFEEYVHMVERQTVPEEITMAIAQRISPKVRQRVIDSYVGSSDRYANPEDRQEVIDDLDDLSIGSEYLRMLVQRMRTGQTTEDLAPENLPDNLFEQVMQFVRALVSRLKARLEVARDPVLAHTINAIESQMRVLEIGKQFQGDPASVTRDDLIFARRRGRATVEVGVDDIDNTLPKGNGWLRPDGNWVAAETISAGDSVQSWEAEMGRFGGHESAALEFLSMNDPNAYALLQEQLNSPDAFERGYEVVTDYMKRMGWLRVVQDDPDQIVFNGVANKAQENALFTSAIIDEKRLVADNGRRAETIYAPPVGGVRAARPGNRIRGVRTGQNAGAPSVPIRGKGGIWQNLKAIVTGNFTDNKNKTGGLFSAGNLTPAERDILQKPRMKIAAETAAAEFAVEQFRRAVKAAYPNGTPPTDVINQALGSTDNPFTDKQLADLKKIKDSAQRDAQRAKFRSDNLDQAKLDRLTALQSLPPKVAKTVEAMRDKISLLSKTMMEGGYIPETLFPVFDDQMDVYLHREYMIFTNPLWADNMKAPQSAEHLRIRVAAEKLFAGRAVAEEAVKLRKIAREQNNPITKAEAMKRAKTMTDVISRRTSDLLLEYLSVADESSRMFFMNGNTVGQRNQSIIKVRGTIPKEVRELWGEVRDAETNFVQTVAKMSAFMAQHDAATELLNHGVENGYLFQRDFDNRSVFNGATRKWDVILGTVGKPGFNSKDDAETWRLAELPKVQAQLQPVVAPAGYVHLIPKGSVSPASIAPLADVYGPPELRDALQKLTSPRESTGFYRSVSFLTSMFMLMKTVGYFPQAFVRNFLSNPFGQLISGGINVENWGSMTSALSEGVRVARLNVGLRGKMPNVEQLQDMRERALKLGVLNDNARGTMLKELYQEGLGSASMKELLTRKDFKSFGEKAGVKALQGVSTSIEKMADLYQGVDDIWKTFGWLMEVENQRRAHPQWTQDRLEEAAASNIRDMVWTYSMSPEITKMVRRVPVLAPFITWTSEVIRATSNSISIANEEMRVGKATDNKAMYRNGVNRRAGQIAAFAALPALGMAVRNIFGYDEEDEEAVRAMLPDWQKNAQIVLLGRSDEGKQMFIDLSYLDPLQVFKEPAIAMYRAYNSGSSLVDIAMEGGAMALSPVFSEQLFAGSMFDIARNRTADGRAIWNSTDTKFNKTSAMIWHVVERGGPGMVVGTVPRIYKAATGQVSPSGRSFNLTAELIAPVAGQRISEIDAPTSLRQAVGRFNTKNTDATQLLSSYMTSRGTVNVADIPAAYDNANRAKREAFEELLVMYNASLTIGTPKGVALTTLQGVGKDSGLSKEDTDMLALGLYRNYQPSRGMYDLTVTRDGGGERIKALINHLRVVNQEQGN